MMTRLSIMERAEILREYAEKVLTLHEEFGDVIARKFAPFDARNYETPDSAREKARRYDDTDTPLMQEIFWILDSAYDKLKARSDEAEREDEMREEAELMFQAWELGLCPYVMREYRRRYAEIPYVWNTSYWEEIAECLEQSVMNAEDTRNAVETWRTMRSGTKARKTA